MHQITPKELGLYQQRQSHSLSASPSRPLNITSLSAGIFITLQGSRKLRGITISIACKFCSPFYPSWFHIALPLRSTYHTLSDSNLSTLPHQFSLRVASVHNTSCTYVQYVVLLVVLAKQLRIILPGLSQLDNLPATYSLLFSSIHASLIPSVIHNV